jgi:hypothetical protein
MTVCICGHAEPRHVPDPDGTPELVCEIESCACDAFVEEDTESLF